MHPQAPSLRPCRTRIVAAQCLQHVAHLLREAAALVTRLTLRRSRRPSRAAGSSESDGANEGSVEVAHVLQLRRDQQAVNRPADGCSLAPAASSCTRCARSRG